LANSFFFVWIRCAGIDHWHMFVPMVLKRHFMVSAANER
jgi:hypothetical protein